MAADLVAQENINRIALFETQSSASGARCQLVISYRKPLLQPIPHDAKPQFNSAIAQ
jgi:hypothetical protein